MLSVMESTWYMLRCYGRPFAGYGDWRIARPVMERHIRACPQGAMPWARRIRWHMVEGHDRPYARAWTTAANGEWLDHVVWGLLTGWNPHVPANALPSP